MCGIVGYVGKREAVPLILDGLGRLEYRGYDSAGVAVICDGQIGLRRDVGKLINLRVRVEQSPLHGQIGIGHTRWATHGVPSERNAHPHVSSDGEFVVVHNGIVENYLELKAELMAAGVPFQSETDTEVIAQWIAHTARHMTHGDLPEATRLTALRLRGAHAIVAMQRANPNQLVAVRIGNAGGVTVGIGQDENFIASDIPAILEYTRDLIFLDSGEMAVIEQNSYRVQRLTGEAVTPELHKIAWDPVSAAKGEYRHFMQKEIFEQGRAITDTLRGRTDFEHGTVNLPTLNLTPEQAQALQRMVITACGTSYYSGLVGKFYLEQLARLPTEVDYASEYRYRDPIISAGTVALAITQSGETADTLAAMAEAKARGATLWSITNAIGSAALRMSDGYITMNAGPEIGVASTKAFTTSLVDQYLIALYLAEQRGTLSAEQVQQHVHDLALLPGLVGQALALDSQIEALAAQFHHVSDCLFLGRGINYPVALEGALKLKEISYIHAEGYPAGEMKHGPIALIDEHLPVIALAPQDALYEKMISQIEQAKARGGVVIALATAGDAYIGTKADHVIELPVMPPLLIPIVAVIPLQLLAYHIAVWRGADVDQPRNLAKSVTVE
ncbi:MAG: glutamine--fructose-6-phosphate transaminase (isomerizing) [Phototrophicaceae bacterium]